MALDIAALIAQCRRETEAMLSELDVSREEYDHYYKMRNAIITGDLDMVFFNISKNKEREEEYHYDGEYLDSTAQWVCDTLGVHSDFLTDDEAGR